MREDLTGKRFGYLTVLSIKENGKKRRSWLCECACGNKLVLGEKWILGSPTRRPNKSCGCKQKKQSGYSMTQPRLFNLWHGMKQRCYRIENENYDRYGGQGVTVCREWQDNFEPFLKWAQDNGYKEDLTLDRIDSQGPYSPDNCRWVDYYTQEQNKGISNRNTTGHVGITYTEGRGYRAYISRNNIRKSLGTFQSLEDAIRARSKAEKHYEKYGTLQNL